MAELIKVYTQDAPALRFIGKRYGDEDRVDGGFGMQWGQFFENGWFGVLEGLCGDPKAIYEDGDAYVGLMRYKDGEPFQYWVGMFLPAGTAVPDGFSHVDFEPARMGVCWLQGPENALYMQEHLCAERLEKEGYKIISDADGAWWFFERYGCPRFTTPDENGHVILDIVHYIQ